MSLNVGDNVNACTLSLSYPGNLPYSASEDDILDFLHLTREEAFIELIADREDPGRKLGFGFATVPAEKVDEVLGLDGATLKGRRIKGNIT